MILPVILSGGQGTRLWPLSRQHFPKQYLSLATEKSLLQETALRVSDPTLFLKPMIICHEEHRFLVAEQLREINVAPSEIVLETESLNTASSIAYACLLQADPNTLLLILPSDHIIQNTDSFEETIKFAEEFAQQNAIITFGIKPTRAETGYGYIKKGHTLNSSNSLFKVDCFIEKPSLEKATDFLNQGEYYWNSGITLFKASTMLTELEHFHPEILDACRFSLDCKRVDLDFLRLGPSHPTLKHNPLSIDHAVMEHSNLTQVIPIDVGWSDIGSWHALWELSPKNNEDNVLKGDVVTQDVHNSYLHSENQLLSVLGLDNIIVIATQDAILVADQTYTNQLKELIQQLKKDNRKELESHTRVYRPWGYYQCIDLGHRFQVKRLMIKPGAKTSTQIHYHRSEHWVVVEGIAKVTRGEETILVNENESIYLPMGIKHRVENPGKIPLHFIEVQSGAYLGEDDIIRIEDSYGRVESTLRSV